MILIENKGLDPYFNLAADEYFTNDSTESIITLWRNDNTIVVGKNQDTRSEINEPFVREKNIHVVRRVTGGGAVYHDLGNLNFSFFTPAEGQKVCDFKKFLNPIREVLSGLGIVAEFSGKNDLLIDGKKFSGNAQLIKKDRILHHGTLLFSSDVKILADCLNPNKQKLASHGVASVKSRVTTILESFASQRNTDLRNDGGTTEAGHSSDEHPGMTGRGAVLTFEEFYARLLNGLVEFFHIEEVRELNSEETAAIGKLADRKHRSKEWIYGASPSFNFSKSKYFAGCGNVTFYMALDDGRINDAMMMGDFIGARDVAELTETFIGKQVGDLGPILSAAEPEQYFLGINRAEFLDWIRDESH